MRKAITGLVVALLAAVALVAISSPALANGEEHPDEPHQDTICHAAGREGTTKFVEVTANHNGIYGQAGHFSEPGTPNAGHEQDYEGPCSEIVTRTVYRAQSDCDGWLVKAQDYADDVPVGDRYVVDQGSWSNPFQLEEATSQFIDGKIKEPENCLVTIRVVSDCGGWAIFRSDQDAAIDGGQWTEPFALEQATSEFVDFIIFEPEDCLLEEGEVIVGVALSCSKDESGVVYQADFGVFISPSGGATVKFNGQEFTQSEGGHIAFGSYGWSAEANEGYVLVGDTEGTVKLKSEDCTRPPETGGPGSLFSDPLVLVGIGTLGLAAIGAGAYGLRRRNQSVV